MDIYADPAYAMATEQFRVVADYLAIEPNLRERMLHPKRAIAVTIVVAFLAGLAGMGLGRLVFAPGRTPSLHEVLHDKLDLSVAQEVCGVLGACRVAGLLF